jgi:integrase
MGLLYKRGNVWWLKYYQNGRPLYESSKSDKKMVAKKLLEQREGEIAQGKIPGVHFEKIRFDELSEDFLRDYRINQKKSIERAEISVQHLKSSFEGMRVTEISTSKIEAYKENRIKDGASNATINRELAALKRMFNLGAKCTPPKVDRVPHIAMLDERNVRKGFFEHPEFIAVKNALPEFLQPVATFAYRTGWRRAEVIDLQWSQVDMEQGIVYLNPGETKNDDSRTIYLDEELKLVIQKQWESRKKRGNLVQYVFPNEAGGGRIKDFRGAWNAACKEAKVDKRIFHDLRRTAVRNLIRAGVPERVAMSISGHKTRSVLDRYNIVNAEDLKIAAVKHEEYLNGRDEKKVTKTVTVGNFGDEKRG